MQPFHSPDNIYWLFSTAAQSLAALMGFLCTGLLFAYQNIDKQIEKDETLYDAYTYLKSEYFTSTKRLLVLMGLSIGLSLLILYVNGKDNAPLKPYIELVTAAAIAWTLWFTIRFVNALLHPNRAESIARQQGEQEAGQNNGEPTPASNKTIVVSFIEKFMELESLLKQVVAHEGVPGRIERGGVAAIPLSIAIRRLSAFVKMDKRIVASLERLNKIRNALIHGGNLNIKPELISELDELIAYFKTLNPADKY